MIWTVPKTWDGATVFILAGGPSLRGFDASCLRPKAIVNGQRVPDWRVITVNDSWRLAPWADCLYFSDPTWYRMQLDINQWALDKSIDFHQLLYKRMLVSGSRTGAFSDHPQIRQLQFTGQRGLETKGTGLRHGSNSAYAAINLAYHFGAKRIVLLGVDMKVAANGRTHWHEQPRPDNFADVLAQSHLPHFQTLVEPLEAAGVEVLNANPESALECWPKVTLDTILKEQEQPV